MKVDLILHNIGELVTCASDGPKRGAAMRDVGLMADGALAIAGSEIVGVGRLNEIEADFQSENLIDAEGRVVCPGFVDPHTHIVFGGDRLDEFELKIKGAEYLEILAAGGGILSTVKATRAASSDDLFEQSLVRLEKMLACGTTTCEIKTGYGLDTETELKMLQVVADLNDAYPIDVVPTFLAAHAVPPEFKNDSDAYVDLICREMVPKAWGWYERSFLRGKAPFFVDVFCEANAFDLEQTRRLLTTAKGFGFGLKAHVDEFTNLGGSRLAIEMGATSIDHLDAISDDETKLLAESDTIGVVTPTVNFNFGSRDFADARKLIDAGCALGVSTDYNPGSAPCPSQPMAMAIASRYQRLLPSEVLNAVTINSAHAIGLGDRVGSIEVGKLADLVILNCVDYRTVANEFGGNLVSSVIKRGKVVYESR